MGSGKKFSLFLENNQAIENREAAYLYENPVELIIASDPEEIAGSIEKIKTCIEGGYHVAGWISYEAGFYLESKLVELLPEENDVPYIYMGVFDKRKLINAQDANYYWQRFENKSAYSLENMKLGQSREYYDTAFDKIQGYLRSGDIYQVNYTQKARFDFRGAAESFYADLRNAQQVEYAAFIETDELKVLSLSPELFIKKRGAKLIAKPMKGTIKRGRNSVEDKKFSETLYNSEKERAENLMIVDLLRNDLSKFAKSASVKVATLYDVEKYRTLFTMTSTIEAEVDGGYSAVDALMSIFPCGSVTGAPKIRAQQIIDELEPHQRGIYTGAIGYFSPDGDMCFSVPIRTISIDNDGKGELGIGGAIVADSVAENEYNECQLKAQFVTRQHPRFDLIETMKCNEHGVIERLPQHMNRLASTADYFSFRFDVECIKNELKEHLKYISDKQAYKIRVLLSRSGKFSITSEKISSSQIKTKANIVLSDKKTSSQDVHLFHKTTMRQFYQMEFDRLRPQKKYLDVIFRNELDQITEGTYTNIFIEKDGVFYTPPVTCGLLSGVYRQVMLEDPEFRTEEKILYIDDVKSADQVYICNSVRGLIPVNFEE